MRKLKKEQSIKKTKITHENKDRAKEKSSSNDKNTTIEPEEFEEDQSMNIRMKPQPLTSLKKKRNKK